jgi:predicted Fe-S protein YdhL (DUF1289 family)
MEFTHPSQMTDEQRKANMAALHERMAKAAERAGGISAKRDAPVAREFARKLRAS